MSNNPVLATVLEILADAQSLMGNALSITWDITKSQESYVSRGPSWQGFNAPAHELFSKGSRLKLMELSPQLTREFQLALQHRLQVSLGMVRSDPPPVKRTASPADWSLESDLQLSGDADMVRKVRIGRIVTVLESTCNAELEVMVGLQIECLRFYKAPSNPFSAENFAAALLQAIEAAIPNDLHQQSLLQVLVPSFAQALKSALRHYAKAMSRKLQALTPVEVSGGRWRQERRDEQYEPTVPAGL
ncbi:hypothetical protein MCEMSEM22_00830 [Comamonadaceae bacterium]